MLRDSQLPVRRRERHCGGLAATALVAAARLGCRCAYAGTLGDDDYSRFVIDRFGEEGCWYASDREPTICYHQPALRVEVVDTIGCGDVFHGAYAAALVRGQTVPEAVRFASVAASLKATRHGGQAGIPTLAAVEQRAAKEYSQHSDAAGNRIVQEV